MFTAGPRLEQCMIKYICSICQNETHKIFFYNMSLLLLARMGLIFCLFCPKRIRDTCPGGLEEADSTALRGRPADLVMG